MKILIIDDDEGLRRTLRRILEEEGGWEIAAASDGEEGLRLAEAQSPDVILCDVRMPRVDGLAFLRRYREGGGEALVVVMTAYGGVDLALEAMKAGAYDYLSKPFGADEVVLALRKAMEREHLVREVGRLRREVRVEHRFEELVARAPAMKRAVELATRVAPHDSPVLVTGDTGTGKELVARLIHRESRRKEAPFVAVNCGAIPESLLESEFFGHVKGAFTGAEREREGLFEAARGGTLFLDEVGELPSSLQVKLLRALQEREVRKVGSDEVRDVDVRLIAATNQPLERRIEEGDFRSDLYYRLAVVPIHLPPLAERREEIPALATHLLERHRARLGVPVERIDPEAMEALSGYAWPGNVRELENVLERAMVMAEGDAVRRLDLPEKVRVPTPEAVRLGGGFAGGDEDLSVKRRTAELEKYLIQRALERTGGNKTAAADLLDLSSRALRYKVHDYDLE